VPEFRYVALTSAAQTIEGRMEAADRSTLVDHLHALGHVPLRVEAVAPSRWDSLFATELFQARRLDARSLALIIGQLATLLRAGLALDEALQIVEELVDHHREKTCIRSLIDRIKAGSTLADAMRAQRRFFPDYCISLVRAGEAGASLETVLERLTEFIERSQATREHIKSALLYPAVVAVVCCISIGILLVFVVPQFRPMFEQSGDALPLSARYLLGFSDFLATYWWAGILICLVVGFGVHRQLRSAKNRLFWQRWLLKTPRVGPLIRQIEVARFSRTLGTLMRNGVPLLSALAIARDATSNSVFAKAITLIIDRAQTGKGLAEPLRETRFFPQLAVRLVRVGEETGRQEEMLARIADIFDIETRRSIDRLLALIAPAVTIVMGLVVAGVIVSMLTALLSVYDLAM
jgi:general secretion pathway protein F